MRRQLTHFSIFFILFCLTIPYHCSSFSAFIASFGPIAFLLLLFYTHHYLLVSFLCVFCMLPRRDPATILLSIFTSLFGFFRSSMCISLFIFIIIAGRFTLPFSFCSPFLFILLSFLRLAYIVYQLRLFSLLQYYSQRFLFLFFFLGPSGLTLTFWHCFESHKKYSISPFSV